MKKISILTFISFFVITQVLAQKKACDLIEVATINKILGTNLIYDPNSIVNKSGKFDCRYTVAGSYDKNIGVGLLEAKIYSGYDMLKIEFDNNQKDIAAGKKAIGKFTKIVAVPKAGANAYYMIGPKDTYTPEAFTFKFRKGDYVVVFSTNDIPAEVSIKNIDEIFQVLSAKL